MIDYRIHTFLKLCETMNYRRTAELLNMTQPAVTQHIHFLENFYEVKLFSYSGKKLSKTEAGRKLEEYARSVMYNEEVFKSDIKEPSVRTVRVGATKTIGDYCIQDLVTSYIQDENIHFELTIDNTANLLKKLDDQQLDFLIVEGYFDKSCYDYRLYMQEELVGICPLDHPFAGKEVDVKEILKEHIILREPGSGTRKVFEHYMRERNYSVDHIKNTTIISSLHLIRKMVSNGMGISFVYRSVADEKEDLSVFRMKDSPIFHEFNYVFLKNSKAISLFEELSKKFR